MRTYCIDGHLSIYHCAEYESLTNLSLYPQQLAINQYWKQIGDTVMPPSIKRLADRFARASFHIDTMTQSADTRGYTDAADNDAQCGSTERNNDVRQTLYIVYAVIFDERP